MDLPERDRYASSFSRSSSLGRGSEDGITLRRVVGAAEIGKRTVVVTEKYITAIKTESGRL